ncbi:OmpP1/FadL family transporter [Alkalilimnicola ehrlichii]|nr:outer membrane protein transport protein [Alkalilimnicola ehrlichii]
MFMHRTYPLAGAALLMAGFVGTANAGSVNVFNHGVKQLGTAYAGAAATAEDVSSAAFNPATLSRLEGQQISGGAFHRSTGGNYRINIDRDVSGSATGSLSHDEFLPYAFYSDQIGENTTIGLGIYSPFQALTQYSTSSRSRYHALTTEYSAININPMVAFSPTNTLSVGFGAIVQYFEGNLTSEIDMGYLIAQGIGAEAVADSRIVNGHFDVYNQAEGDDLNYAFNAGILWQPASDTRVGISYRSRTNHVLDGNVRRPLRSNYRNSLDNYLIDFDISEPERGEIIDFALSPAGAGRGAFESRFTVPETLSLGVNLELSRAWHVMAGATLTRWSQMENIELTFSDAGEVTLPEPIDGTDVNREGMTQRLSWSDTWQYSIGTSYRLNEQWTLRGGYGIDPSPVSGSGRNLRLPYNDRTWYTIGASYQFSPALSIDGAYAFIDTSPSSVNNERDPASGHRANGRTGNMESHTLAIQANYRF